MNKASDSAAFVDSSGEHSNALLHEQMTQGVHDHDFRLQTKKKLIALGVPQEDMDRLIQ